MDKIVDSCLNKIQTIDNQIIIVMITVEVRPAAWRLTILVFATLYSEIMNPGTTSL